MSREEKKQAKAARREAQKADYKRVKELNKTPERRFKNARRILFAVSIWSLINVGCYLVEAIFSFYAMSLPDLFIGWLGTSTLGVALSLIPIGLVALFAWLSKQHYLWLAGALTVFMIDTIVAVLIFIFALVQENASYEYLPYRIFELVFHAAVLYQLIMGIKAGVALKDNETVPVAFGDLTRDTSEADLS